MQLVHDQLTKPQRALRAYLNKEKVPAGFKGGRLIEGIKPRDLTHFHLSRYAYTFTVILNQLAHYIRPDAKDKNGHKYFYRFES